MDCGYECGFRLKKKNYLCGVLDDNQSMWFEKREIYIYLAY